jgi:hypothetical protein
MDEVLAQEGWHIRPLILAAIGLAAGLCVHLILGSGYHSHLSTIEAATLTGVALVAGLTGFTLERRLWWMSILFSAATALVGALIVAWSGSPEDWSVGEGWRMVSLLLAVAIAAPLFQAARDEGARRFPYPVVHDHAWTNVVLFGACWVFVGIVFALAWLLAMLFDLIKIDFLKELLEKNWFWRSLIGLAFGAALGLLREHDGVVRLLQRVVALVLAVLAPVLAVGLVLFVLALPFTGLNALWAATKSTTSILLFCVVGALILANAVIGNAPDQERRFPLLRYGAMALAAVMLPLAVLAAVAVSLRTGQYGFTPERLWAIVFVALACLWAAAYLVALVRGRLDWAARVRPLNLALAFVVCGVALVLATPLVSFNAISTRDQLARLESGKVTPEQFDWRALAFDFGQPGRNALKKLRASHNATIRAKAVEADAAKYRYDLPIDPVPAFAGAFDVRPAGAPLPEALRKLILEERVCVGDNLCRIYLHDPKAATVLDDACAKLPRDKRNDPKDKCGLNLHTYLLTATGWLDISNMPQPVDPQAKPVPPMPEQEERLLLDREYRAVQNGEVTVRKVEMRQVFLGDKPQGRPFK